MNLVDMGHGVWVGDYRACDERGRDFPNVVHIWRQANVIEGRLCRVCKGIATRPDKGLSIEWTEGQPLSAMSVPLADVVAYLRRPGDVLIHCAAGACRSPTLAVMAKIARGDGPWGAIGHVSRRTWEGRGFAAWLMPEPMGDVLMWWEQEANRERPR